MSGITRTWRCTRFETAKTMRRPRTAVLAALMILGPIAAGLVEGAGDEPGRGFVLLAEILRVSLPITSFLLTVAGCLTLSEETGSGSLRAVAVAPVSRIDVIGGKLCAMALAALAAWALTIAVAVAWVSLAGGFAPVTIEIPGLEPVVKFSVSEMTSHAWRLLAATAPAVLCSPIFGLAVATVIDGEGASMAASVAGYAALRAWAGLEDEGTWAFTSGISRPVELLSEVARGVETNLDEVEAMSFQSLPVAAATVSLAVLATFAVVVFARKEIRC